MTTTHTDPALDLATLEAMRAVLLASIVTNQDQEPNVPTGPEADAHRAARTTLERAVARIDDGTYGACAGCGRPIPLGRLELVPEAEHCVTCAQRPASLLS